MGRIVHGNRNFGYAPINYDAGTQTYSFGTPVMIPGMVSSSMEIEQEDTNIYADDKTFCVIKGAKVRNLEVAFRNIPDSYAEYLGFKMNDNGMLTDTGTFANHCVFFETEEEDCDTGEATTTLHYIYNVKGGEPSKESATDEEEVEAQEISVSYTAMESQIAVDDDNVPVMYGYVTRTNTNKTKYDEFTTKVILPTDSLT